MDGIVNVYKEKGFTSHDAVAVVRKCLHIKRVGHTGTLDPDAEGVLPICVGEATKLADYIMNGKKSYRAMLRLGITTTTEDASGEVVEEKPVSVTEAQVRTAAASLVGERMQIPPMYSAIKVHGKKLYELAREGKEVERKARKVTIYAIRLLRFLPPDRAELEIDCSKGTYIRSLCREMGEILGCGGHMESLLRTATGQFHLENAITLAALRQKAEEGKLEEVLIPMEKALSDYPQVTVDGSMTKLLHNGGRIPLRFASSDRTIKVGNTVVVFDSAGVFTGLYLVNQEEKGVVLKPLRLMAAKDS